MTITIGTHNVVLADKWTHKMTKLFETELFKNGEAVSPESVFRAYESVFPIAIVSVDGSPYSVAWSDDLPEDDYKELRKAVDSISGKSGAGKKNT